MEKTIYFKDDEIIINDKTGDGIQKVIDKFQPWIEIKANTFLRDSGYQKQDLVCDMVSELYNCMLNYDDKRKERVAFPTYAWKCINNKIISWINENKRKRTNGITISLVDDTRENPQQIEQQASLVNYASRSIGDNIDIKGIDKYLADYVAGRRKSYYVRKKIIAVQKLLVSGYNQKEISLMLGMTHQRINMYTQELREVVEEYIRA